MRTVLCVLLLCISACAAQQVNWTLVDQTIQQGMVNVTPGAVAIVGTKNGIVYARAFGRLTYSIPPPFDPIDPPMTLSVSALSLSLSLCLSLPLRVSTHLLHLQTLFDLASLTKVIGGNNAIAQFYQRGQLDLSMSLLLSC